MTIQILDMLEGNDDIIITIYNVHCIPSKGDEIYINGRFGIVSHFLWNMNDTNDVNVDIFVHFK